MEDVTATVIKRTGYGFPIRDLSKADVDARWPSPPLRESITTDFHRRGELIASVELIGELRYDEKGNGSTIKVRCGKTTGIHTWVTQTRTKWRVDCRIHIKQDDQECVAEVFFYDMTGD